MSCRKCDKRRRAARQAALLASTEKNEPVAEVQMRSTFIVYVNGVPQKYYTSQVVSLSFSILDALISNNPNSFYFLDSGMREVYLSIHPEYRIYPL